MLSGWDFKTNYPKNAIMQHLSLVRLAVKVTLKMLDTFFKAILLSVICSSHSILVTGVLRYKPYLSGWDQGVKGVGVG